MLGLGACIDNLLVIEYNEHIKFNKLSSPNLEEDTHIDLVSRDKRVFLFIYGLKLIYTHSLGNNQNI